MSAPYFDANRCAQHFHYFKRTQNGIEPFHSDDQPCAESEYFLPMDAPEVKEVNNALANKSDHHLTVGSTWINGRGLATVPEPR